jgi:hypothetical protein
MADTSFRLAVDEVAMALTQVGEADLARDLLLAGAGGTLTGDTAQGRLLAAGHSLMARGLLEVDADGSVRLDETLARVLRPLAKADFSIRVSCSYGSGELARSYHFAGPCVISQEVDRDIIYTLAEFLSRDAALASCVEFFDTEDTAPFAADPVTLPMEVLDEIQETADPEAVHARLATAGMPESVRAMFVPDFQGVVFRGGILRVDFGSGDGPASNRGALILRGPQRLWVMRILPEGDTARLLVMAGGKESLRNEILALIEPASASGEAKP